MRVGVGLIEILPQGNDYEISCNQNQSKSWYWSKSYTYLLK